MYIWPSVWYVCMCVYIYMYIYIYVYICIYIYVKVNRFFTIQPPIVTDSAEVQTANQSEIQPRPKPSTTPTPPVFMWQQDAVGTKGSKDVAERWQLVVAEPDHQATGIRIKNIPIYIASGKLT